MKALYNKEFIDDQKPTLEVDDRAFQYGDGIFETIVPRDNQIKLLKYHYNRLKDGATALGLHMPDYFTLQYLRTCIFKLIEVNKLKGIVRIKVQVWRSGGGFYSPLSNSSNILITSKPHRDREIVLKNVGISSTIRNHITPFSQYKTTNALKYILASIEKNKSNHDDLIILDQNGHISELLYSNIFWNKNDTFYTPSLETGCIRGVMRSYLMDKMTQKGIHVHEVETLPNELRFIDHVFATNAAGITPIVGINRIKYKIYSDLNSFIKLLN